MITRKRKNYFFGVGRLERFALESRERIPVVLTTEKFIPDVVATRCGSIEFPPDVAAETSSQMWP